MSDVQVLQGDCREMLRTLPAASVHICVTSPPYWALRDYKIPPAVWGGDPDCAHVWGDWREQHDQREAPIHGKTRTTDRHYADGSRRFDGNHQRHTAGASCQSCGAWLGCLGLEPDPWLYVEHMVLVFREVERVLHPSGTLWLNLGDSYANDGKWGGTTGGKHAAGLHGEPVGRLKRTTGLKPKDLIGIPWLVAFALRDDGWYLRMDNIWSKSNPMPESVRDRPTRAHEYVFLLSKAPRYYYDSDAVREPSLPERTAGKNSSCQRDKIPVSRKKTIKAGRLIGDHGTMGHDGNGKRYERVYNHPLGRNKRSVWTVATAPYPDAHYATFPPRLIEPCILAGTSKRGCCPECLAPWRRIVTVAYDNPGNRSTNGPRSLERRHETAGFAVRLQRRAATVGWESTCTCPPHEPIPCTVLDPFAGTGTTLAVALSHGRHAIGIEVNAADMPRIRKRLANVQPPQPTLFDEVAP